MKKILGALVLVIGVFSFITTKPVYAFETTSINYVESTKENSVASYDMSKGGKQEFIIIDEQGEENILSITKEKNNNHILGNSIDSMSLKNGTYTISNKRAGSWEASYQIVLSSEKITATKNAKATAITGSFISKVLKIDNSKQATYYLKKKNGLDTVNINLRAKIYNSKISISL